MRFLMRQGGRLLILKREGEAVRILIPTNHFLMDVTYESCAAGTIPTCGN